MLVLGVYMTSIHGLLFRSLDRFGVNLSVFWERSRSLFYTHKTLFDFLFLVIYSLEQLSLLVLILSFPNYANLIVSTFIILFLFTIGLERICMESRYNQYKDKIHKMANNYLDLQSQNKELLAFIKRIGVFKKGKI